MALAFPRFDFVSYTHSGPCKVAGQGPQSESIRHYLDKECLEKNDLCSLVVLVRAEFA